MPETMGLAQNAQSYKFSAPQTPRKIQNSFLERALIPYDYNTGLQLGIFSVIFHKNQLKEGNFKNQKLT